MIRKVAVEDINYGGRRIASSALLNSDGSIFWEPTLFLLHRVQNGLKPSSAESYAQDLVTYLNVVDTSSGDLNWKDVTDQQMTAYIQTYLQGNRKAKQKSITRHIATLQSLYNWAWDVKMLDQPPAFTFGFDHQIPKSQGKQSVSLKTNYIHEKEFEELIGSVNQSSSFLLERDELVLAFGYYSGLRAQEVTDLRNFNTLALRKRIFEAKDRNEMSLDIEIIGKGDKLRTIVIPPELFQLLEKYILGRRKKILDGPLICKEKGLALNRQHASSVFSKARDKCKDEVRVRLSLLRYHSLRHTYATNLVTWCYQNNRDPWQLVPERMGHEDKETTLGYVTWEAYLNNRVDIVDKLSMGTKRKCV
jgi:integrase